MQVFIVDDSALVRERLAELLDEVQDVHVIGEAATVADALLRIPLTHPDFVMLDARMPDGDGTIVLTAVKHLEEPPLVGLLTSFPSEAYRQRCLALGADFFWDKSKDLALVPIVLRALADGGGRRGEAWMRRRRRASSSRSLRPKSRAGARDSDSRPCTGSSSSRAATSGCTASSVAGPRSRSTRLE